MNFESVKECQASSVSKLDLRGEIVPAVCMAASGQVYIPLQFGAHPKPGQR